MRTTLRLVYVLAILRFIFPYIIQDSFYQPHRDEFLYLFEGHHLAWGYMEIPPLLAVLAKTVHWLGDGFFWIKFWPSVFGSLTLILVGKMVVSLGGRIIAVVLSALPFFNGVYLRLFFLFQPNSLDVFFWTALAYCILRYIQSQNRKWLYGFGICVGLGMMSKYSTAFYSLALLLGLLFTKQRRIYLQKDFYIAMAMSFFIFLPNLIWQYNHRFPVIHHMQELQEEQLRFIGPIRFLVSQMLMNLASVFVWVAGFIFVAFSRQAGPYRWLAWSYLNVIVLLVILHGKDYYALGAYPALYAFGGYRLEQLTQLRWRWTRYVMITVSLLFGLLILPLMLPVAKPGELAAYFERSHLNEGGGFTWEDLKLHPLPQDYADMMGWKEMAEKTAAAYHHLSPEMQQQTMIYCRGYYFAGALNYYGPALKLPEVYSDHASFLLWMPDRYNIKHLMIVAHNIPEPDDKVFQQFEKLSLLDSLQNPLARENGVRIMFFENGNDSLNSILDTGVARLKAVYKR